MKKGLKLVALVLVVVAVSGLASCDLLNPNKLVGTWSRSAAGATLSWTFERDKTGEISSSILGISSSIDFTYTYTADTVTITYVDDTTGPSETYDYSIDGDVLSLTYSGLTLTLTKE